MCLLLIVTDTGPALAFTQVSLPPWSNIRLNNYVCVRYLTGMQGPLGILETLRSAVLEVSATVAAHRDKSRRALADMVCEQFRLVDAHGKKRLAGCMKALRVLHSEEQIALPSPQVKLQIAKPRLLGKPVPEAVGVPADVREIEDFEIVRVDSAQDRAIWDTLMDQEHPRGVSTFAGAQMRYLISACQRIGHFGHLPGWSKVWGRAGGPIGTLV